MNKVSINIYDPAKGENVVDQPIIAATMEYFSRNNIADTSIAIIEVAGNNDDKSSMINTAVDAALLAGKNPIIYAIVTVSPFEYNPRDYTIKHEDENDTRKLIDVDKVIENDISIHKAGGFTPLFGNNPGEISCICVYTGSSASEHTEGAIEFIRSLPKENPEPTRIRLTQEELAKMMGGGNNAEEADSETE